MSHLNRISYPTPSSEAASAVMRANRRVDTKPEAAMRSALHRRGLRFRKDYPIRVGGRLTRPDVAFPRQKVAVFVDGCFWHRCPTHGSTPRSNTEYWSSKLDGNVERDRAVNKSLAAAGWRVIRVWEHQPTEVAAEHVIEALHGRAHGTSAPRLGDSGET